MSLMNMMAQTAVIYNKIGYNKFGRDQDGSGTTTRCRFQDKSQLLRVTDQEVVQLIGVFYFPPTATVNTEDRITYNGSNYKAFGVNTSIDGRGQNRLTKVTVTKWQT